MDFAMPYDESDIILQVKCRAEQDRRVAEVANAVKNWQEEWVTVMLNGNSNQDGLLHAIWPLLKT